MLPQCTAESSLAGWLLELYILARSTVISAQVPTCASAQPWQLYSAARTMKSEPDIQLDQLHFPDTELTSPCRILLMPHARLGSDKYQFDKSLV